MLRISFRLADLPRVINDCHACEDVNTITNLAVAQLWEGRGVITEPIIYWFCLHAISHASYTETLILSAIAEFNPA